MTFRITASRLAVLAGLSATPALADVTGAEVWADWQSYMAGFGYTVTGAENQSGNTLTVSDVTMSQALPDEAGSVTISMSEVTFMDNSDGTVAIGMPEQTPMVVDITAEDSPQFSGTFVITQVTPSMVASGDRTNMTYTYATPELSMSVADLPLPEDEGAPLADAPRLTMNIKAVNLENVTRTTKGETDRTYNQTANMVSLAYDFAVKVPEANATATYSGTMNEVSYSSDMQSPAVFDASKFDQMINAGLSVTGAFQYVGGSGNFDSSQLDGQMATSSSDSGAFAFSMNADGIDISTEQRGLKSDFQSAEIPFPLSIALSETLFNLKLPVASGEAAQDFALGFTLGGLEVSEGLWNMVDPGVQLPRDPASIAIDLSGQARMLMDLFSPETGPAIERGETPAELDALSINNLLVSVAGAALTGAGSFSFDNSDTTTFNGMPKPTGAVDLRLEGANALLDTLVQIGLLPADQAMGARMMMGLFGTPDGDDALVSKIEINDQGHVLANGQRLQ